MRRKETASASETAGRKTFALSSVDRITIDQVMLTDWLTGWLTDGRTDGRTLTAWFTDLVGLLQRPAMVALEGGGVGIKRRPGWITLRLGSGLALSLGLGPRRRPAAAYPRPPER